MSQASVYECQAPVECLACTVYNTQDETPTFSGEFQKLFFFDNGEGVNTNEATQ